MTNNLSVTKEFELTNRFAAKPLESVRSQLIWLNLGAFGMVGGFVFPLLGALISKALESGGDVSPALQKFTDIVSLLCIPLLIFGSFCLNKTSEQITAKRDTYSSADDKSKSL